MLTVGYSSQTWHPNKVKHIILERITSNRETVSNQRIGKERRRIKQKLRKAIVVSEWGER